MIEVNIPRRGVVQLEHLVCDFNGTRVVDGRPVEGVVRNLTALRGRLEVHLISADILGRQAAFHERLAIRSNRLPPGDEAPAKAEYVWRLRGGRAVAVGNGANDAERLHQAADGICLHNAAGVSIEAVMAADAAAPPFLSALGLLDNPMRLAATLRR